MINYFLLAASLVTIFGYLWMDTKAKKKKQERLIFKMSWITLLHYWALDFIGPEITDIQEDLPVFLYVIYAFSFFACVVGFLSILVTYMRKNLEQEPETPD